jgi:hypothetical protein
MSKPLTKRQIILISCFVGIFGLAIILCAIFIPIYYVYWRKSKSATNGTVVVPETALSEPKPKKSKAKKKTHTDLMSSFTSYNY